jgi:hypothetical protein
MKDFYDWMNAGLCAIGYLFILVKAFEWFVSVCLKKWDKCRKESRRQKAVNELYYAFNLDEIEAGSTVRLATKGGLTIMMYRN